MIITPKLIKELVEKTSKKEDISIKTRKRPYPDLRFISFKLCKDFIPKISLFNIGKFFNNLDHATVLHGLKRFEELKSQPSFKDSIEVYKSVYLDLKKLSDETFDDDEFLTSIILSNIQSKYRIKHIKLVEKTHEVIGSLTYKLHSFRYRKIFHEIASMDEDSLDDFEIRAKAFIRMNNLKKQNEKRIGISYGKKKKLEEVN